MESKEAKGGPDDLVDEKKASAKHLIEDPEENYPLAAPDRADAKEPTGSNLVHQVCEFYFDNVDLQSELEAWTTTRAGSFSPLDQEYTIEQTELFKEFSALFESRMER